YRVVTPMERAMLQVRILNIPARSFFGKLSERGACSRRANVFPYRDTVTRRRGMRGAGSDPTRGKSYGKRNGSPTLGGPTRGRAGSRAARAAKGAWRAIFRESVGWHTRWRATRIDHRARHSGAGSGVRKSQGSWLRADVDGRERSGALPALGPAFERCGTNVSRELGTR